MSYGPLRRVASRRVGFVIWLIVSVGHVFRQANINLLQLIKAAEIETSQCPIGCPPAATSSFPRLLIYITLIDLLTDSAGQLWRQRLQLVASRRPFKAPRMRLLISLTPYLINVRFSQFMKLH